MTRVLVNAVSIREGGPLVVLQQLTRAMAQARPQWDWQIATSERTARLLPAHAGVKYIGVPEEQTRGWRVRLWYERHLAGLARELRADVLFSQTNYLPWRDPGCPSVLLVQHAGHFDPRFAQATLAASPGFRARAAWAAKCRWVHRSVSRASRILVQTHALADKIARSGLAHANKIATVAHGPGVAQLAAKPATPAPPGQPFRIGYISKWGVQKNFGVLLRAAQRLQSRGLPVKVVLTVPTAEAADGLTIAEFASARRAGILENHGELRSEELVALYATLHAFAFPSWCESWGFPMVEAMAHGLPLFVADTPSNREVAADGACAFGADDDETLARLLERAATDAQWHGERARAALERAHAFSWAAAAAGTIEALEHAMQGAPHG